MAAENGIAVFCGSRPGNDPVFLNAVQSLGREIALSGNSLIYGGGNPGLMGALADAALAAGGHVVGIIPVWLQARGLAHDGLHELITVDSLKEGKRLMFSRSRAAIVVPGGIGTLDELFDVYTNVQLGQLSLPIGLLNVSDFYRNILRHLELTVKSGFLEPEHLDLLTVDDEPARLLRRLLELSLVKQV